MVVIIVSMNAMKNVVIVKMEFVLTVFRDGMNMLINVSLNVGMEFM